MFGNNYFTSMPTATQPYGYPIAPYPQGQYSVPSAQSATPQQPTMNTNKIYVSGIDDVKSRVLPFNSDMVFIDNDKPLIYQKVVDGKGQFEIKTFTITPYTPQESAKETPSIDLSGYAKKDDLGAISGEIKALKEQVNKLTKDRAEKEIEKLKSGGL